MNRWRRCRSANRTSGDRCPRATAARSVQNRSNCASWCASNRCSTGRRPNTTSLKVLQHSPLGGGEVSDQWCVYRVRRSARGSAIPWPQASLRSSRAGVLNAAASRPCDRREVQKLCASSPLKARVRWSISSNCPRSRSSACCPPTALRLPTTNRRRGPCVTLQPLDHLCRVRVRDHVCIVEEQHDGPVVRCQQETQGFQQERQDCRCLMISGTAAPASVGRHLPSAPYR